MFEQPKAKRPFPATDQRKGRERRQVHDRREEIRYEPDRDGRRSGADRRKHGGWDGAPIQR